MKVLFSLFAFLATASAAKGGSRGLLAPKGSKGTAIPSFTPSSKPTIAQHGSNGKGRSKGRSLVGNKSSSASAFAASTSTSTSTSTSATSSSSGKGSSSRSVPSASPAPTPYENHGKGSSSSTSVSSRGGKASRSSPSKGSNSTEAPTVAPTTLTIDEVGSSSSFPLRGRRRMSRRRLRRGDGTGYSAKGEGSSPMTSKSSKIAKSSYYHGNNTTTAAPTPFPSFEDTEILP